MATTELHTKHRPQEWDQIVGNATIVKAIRKTLDAGLCSAFLFTGEPGVGKTSVARLIAKHVGANVERGIGYSEYDGATNTGVDDTRAIMQRARLKPLGAKKGSKQVVVIDESHYLSKNAWNSLLKMVEEPPPGLVWVFCTSEGTKVPASIRSRCQEFHLAALSEDEIENLIMEIAKREKIKLCDDMVDLIVVSAQGIPRNAIVGLGKIAGLGDDVEAAERILQNTVSEDTAEVIEFCRMLMKGHSSFPQLAKVVIDLKGTITAEGVRNVVCSYFTKLCTSNQWERAAAVLTGFGTPYPPGIGDSMVPVLVSLGSVLQRD